jgi:hypothetical protein
MLSRILRIQEGASAVHIPPISQPMFRWVGTFSLLRTAPIDIAPGLWVGKAELVGRYAHHVPVPVVEFPQEWDWVAIVHGIDVGYPSKRTRLWPRKPAERVKVESVNSFNHPSHEQLDLSECLLQIQRMHKRSK